MIEWVHNADALALKQLQEQEAYNIEQNKRRERLVKASSMCEEGLITREQFEEIKAQVTRSA